MKNPPAVDGTNDPSISNFTTAILLAGILFIYEMIGQIKEATDSQQIAEWLSIYTIAINTTWNFSYFNLFLRYALTFPEYKSLTLAAIMYFVITFIFEFRLLLIVWRF